MIREKWTGTSIKLTNGQHQTQNNCQWGKGVANPHGVRSGNDGLCGDGFYHGYDTTPELALFLNPMHADITNPVVWLAQYRGKREDDKCLKFGATEMKTVRVLKVQMPTTIQRVVFSLLVAEFTLDAVNGSIPEWQAWAEKFISGEDRSEAAARSAARSAAWSAESAAWSAESAAWSAAWSAESAARSAESAAWSAAWSAESAAWSAARSAARSAANILENAAAFAVSRTWESPDLLTMGDVE